MDAQRLEEIRTLSDNPPWSIGGAMTKELLAEILALRQRAESAEKERDEAKESLRVERYWREGVNRGEIHFQKTANEHWNKIQEFHRRAQSAEGERDRLKAEVERLKTTWHGRPVTKAEEIEIRDLRSRLADIETAAKGVIEAQDMFFRYGPPWQLEGKKHIDALKDALAKEGR